MRSKKPNLVRQEIWGLLIAHYAIRALMVEAADTADLDPDRLSFLRTLNIVRRQVMNQAGFPPETINRRGMKQSRRSLNASPLDADNGPIHVLPNEETDTTSR